MRFFIKKSIDTVVNISINTWKDRVKKYLDSIENKEDSLKKSFAISMAFMDIKKSGYPIGSIREWKGGTKFKKVAPNKWVRIYEKETRGAKLAIAVLKKKVDACKSESDIMQLMLENSSRFIDKNGYPIPLVQNLSDFIRQKGDKITKEQVNFADKGRGVEKKKKAKKPEWLKGRWNGKIYGGEKNGYSVYGGGEKYNLTKEMHDELLAYLGDKPKTAQDER
ncbi:MAG: hypothetical protein ACRC4W_05320, partial [Treponemataceae bacterium]